MSTALRGMLRSRQLLGSSARWVSTIQTVLPNIESSRANPTHSFGATSVSEQPSADVESIADDLVHVKLSYLHPSTKDPPDTIRAGDLKSGRIRPTPVYVPLSRKVFNVAPRRDLLHSAVVYYLDSRRKGTASTKTRGEVSFSGAKIRPQKGSGQARLGTRSNPLLRKGGVAHGPHPRDMSSKLNRRVRELALRSALSAKWLQGDLMVVKNLDWIPSPSTGLLRNLLKSRKWDDSIFLTAPRHPSKAVPLHPKLNAKPSATDPEYTEAQIKEHADSIKYFISASNNIPRLETFELNKLKAEADLEAKTPADKKKPGELHAYHVLKRKTLVCDLGAIEWLEEKLGGTIFHVEEIERIVADLAGIAKEGEGEGIDSERPMVAEDIEEEAERVLQAVKSSA
ncbi:hypothetical protein CBS101457_005523 [Exobasidium rhododendri]|nr:hypothetical protein CBS101457_005523 [Exobasidium rhododendri]